MKYICIRDFEGCSDTNLEKGVYPFSPSTLTIMHGTSSFIPRTVTSRPHFPMICKSFSSVWQMTTLDLYISSSLVHLTN